MIGVLAGNYSQYMHWCSENRMHPNRDAKFLHDRHQVLGYRFDEITRVGTWWEAPQEAREAWLVALASMHRDNVVWGNC